MKYSKELECMIESVIAKGIITEQERNSIVRKAVIQGIDPEDLNTELDARIRSHAISKEVPTPSNPSSVGSNHSMFSKELEGLIHATLEDGVLEDNEKAALVKRAEREGVDIAELEIYINSLLQKRARELENEKNAVRKQAEKEKKEAFGRKCPNCGAQVPPLTLKCECGYEFTNEKHESSVKLLSEKIGKIQSRQLKGEPDSYEWKADKKLRDQEMLDAISLFPVPNTKEDIVEFLSLAAPNARQKGGFFGTVPKRLIVLGILAVIIIFVFYLLDPPGHGKDSGMLPLLGGIYVVVGAIAGAFLIDKDTLRWNKSATVWRAKFEQVLMKGRSLRGDSEFTQQLDYYESMLNKK